MTGAVGCAGGGRWCFSYVLVVVLGWLCLVHGLVVVVRWSWAFVGRLSSFSGGQGRFWHWVCLKRYGGDVVGGRICTIV